MIEVVNGVEKQHYSAQLQLMVNADAFHFTLLNAGPVAASGTGHPSFATATGFMTVPLVELDKTYGVERYQASLQLIPNSNPATFTLVSIGAVISPDYKPGLTWKPYVGLLPNEKQAIDLLEQSRPFTELAEGVYDFSIKSIGNWDLIQEKSTDAGMQAGVYRNRVTNALVIAFRGTEELCLIPVVCTFKEIEESGNDALTDTLLTQGRDSGQFDDAFNFARDVIAAYPDDSITVTGHSLGGGLAQVVGASYLLETFAFNSSPVPNNFWNDHGVSQFDERYANIIHVLSDIHDPVSSTNHLGAVYSDAAHVTPNIQFDFDNKEIMPTYKTTLDSLRLNKHSMTKLRENIAAVTDIYQGGW